MPKATELDIKRILGWLSGSISLAIMVILPISYYYTSYQYIKENTDIKASSIASDLSKFAFKNTDTWLLQDHRIQTIIESNLDNANNYVELVDTSGEQIFSNNQTVAEPVLRITMPVSDVHQQLATVHMEASLGELVQQTIIVFFFSLVLSAVLFLILYKLPLRALMSAVRRLQMTQEFLQQEILEKGKALNEAHELSRKLHEMAMHDALTGLPNRTMLYDYLAQAMSTAERNNEAIAAIMLDLNRFKEVNNTLGHHIGDTLLVEIANQLKSELRKSDIIARLGGDEFALVAQIKNPHDSEIICRTILEAIKRPIEIEDYDLSIKVSGSCGIAIYPDHGNTPTEIMQKADIAMYAAKKTSSNIAIYKASQDSNTPERLKLVHQLSDAITQNDLYLVYQPKLDIETLQPIGVEALIRWKHPTEGMISPGLFIPWAEETEIIHPLTDWVIDTALKQQQEWKKLGVALDVSLNISGKNLREPDFHHKVAIAMQRLNTKPEEIILEVTESAMIDNTSDAKIILEKLSDLGVRLSIDDFGTGHASLVQLKNFPFNELKIDRSFVDDMVSDDSDAAIVESAITLANSLHMKTVAEGIENQKTLDLLKQMGCDIAQGFYLSKPLISEELINWIQSYQRENRVKDLNLTNP